MQQPAGPYSPVPVFPLTFSVEYPDRPLNRALHRAPVPVDHPDRDHRFPCRLGGDRSSRRKLLVVVGRGRHPGAAPRADDPVPPEVPTLVVRLEPATHQVPGPSAGHTPNSCATNTRPPTRSRRPSSTSPIRTPCRLNRWLPLVKWFLAIPHWIVLAFLWIGVAVCVIIAWFAILFTGRYPLSLFDVVVGVNRWTLRVEAYALLLITDQYPPFSSGLARAAIAGCAVAAAGAATPPAGAPA